MNNTSLPCSLNDTTELRQMILENPDLPLIVFAGEEAWGGDYGYTQADVRCQIETLTSYKDMWRDEEDYEDELRDDLSDEVEYKDLSDKEYDKMIAEKIANTEFVKAIVVYVG